MELVHFWCTRSALTIQGGSGLIAGNQTRKLPALGQTCG